MRGSTAAWINISLLPRDCGCGEFADGAVLGRGLFFLVFVGFPVVLSGEEAFFLAFVRNLPMVPSGEEASFLCHLWHSAHSVPEKASCGTEYACGAQNRLLWYAAQKTGFSGTGVIFGTGNPLLWYRTDIRVRKKASCGTRCIFRGTRCAEQAFLVREWYSTAARVVQTERNTKNKSHLFLSTRWSATKVSSKLPQKLVIKQRNS